MGILFWSKSKRQEKEAQFLKSIKDAVAAVLDEKKPAESEFSVTKAYFINKDTFTVRTSTGKNYVKNGATVEDFHKVAAATSDAEVKAVMEAQPSPEQIKDKQEQEQRAEKLAIYKTLLNHEEFEEKEGSLYVKGINLSLPEVIVDGFLQVINEPEAFSALKRFWYWLAINPNPESREDAYKFIKYNDVKITSHGLLVLYRGIVSKGDENKDLVAAISTNFAKIKSWKKSPKNYQLVKLDVVEETVVEDGYDFEPYDWDDDEDITTWPSQSTQTRVKKVIGTEYQLIKAGQATSGEILGTLDVLYEELPELKANTYTDAHTKTMQIKIGSVYKIDEDLVDRDNRVECSNGLHVGSMSFGIGSFGDTKVMALVNPSKIRAVPQYDSKKMRVSEMFIAAVLEQDANGNYMDSEMDLVEFNDLYFALSVEELEEMAKGVNITELSKHKLLPSVDFNSLGTIVGDLAGIRDAIANRVTVY